MKFGENLKKLRKSANLSQEELADKVKVSRQSVSKWETGEAYPEMNNILQLCKIFKCEINSLVNDSITDSDSLDEDVKMKVVKFKEDKQKKMKGLSKAIYIISRIAKVFTIIGIVAVVVSAILLPIVGSNIKLTKPGEIKVFGEIIKYDRTNENSIVISHKDKSETIKDKKDIEGLNIVFDYIEDTNTTKVVIFGEFAIICLTVSLVLIFKALDHLDKLFVNINKGDTPFTMDNVLHIKKMAWLMIWLIVFPFITGILAELAINTDLSIGLSGNSLLMILVLFSLSYVFEYGYEIQLDSKGKMYGDSDE